MSGPTFQRILSHGVYQVQLASTDDGYTVRLVTSRFSPAQRARFPDMPWQPMYMTNVPDGVGGRHPSVFFSARKAWRDELIGWIKATLARDDVASVWDYMPFQGERPRAIRDFDLRLHVLPREMWPSETVVTQDDLVDLDRSGRGMWREPVDGDYWVKW